MENDSILIDIELGIDNTLKNALTVSNTMLPKQMKISSYSLESWTLKENKPLWDAFNHLRSKVIKMDMTTLSMEKGNSSTYC